MKPSSHRNSYQPKLEQLESRINPATTGMLSLNLSVISIQQGVISVRGSDHNEWVTADYIAGDASRIHVTYSDLDTGAYHSEVYNARNVTSITFHAEGGDDYFNNSTAKNSMAYGGEGRDQLIGGAGRDTFYGQGGGDLLYGLQGNDTLDGGDGADDIKGADGADTIIGGAGGDTIEGGMHNDTINGGAGDDEIYGYQGADTINGGEGDDEIYGGTDNDTINGGDGNDTINGEEGRDTIHGGDGDDVLEGGDGNDSLLGDDGHDRLYGGAGDDTINAGDGNDSLWGGGGIDTLIDGAGADRFLIDIDTDLTDIIPSADGVDVRVFFQDMTGDHADGSDWTGGAWTYAEIIEVDEALAALVAATGNNTLLRTDNGYQLTMRRVGHALGSSDAAAWNNSGTGYLTFADPTFEAFHDGGSSHRTSFDDEVHHVVHHEVGHNWDSENDRWNDWRNISDWRNPLIGGWRIHGTVGFASGYAHSSPYEDFAETFALYFAVEAGETFNGNDSANLADRMPQKMEFIDDFIATLR